MSIRSTRPVSVALLVGMSACLAPTDDLETQAEPPSRLDPQSALQAIEDRLLAPSADLVEFVVFATGAVEADLKGRLLLGGDGQDRLEASGSFAGSEVELLLVSNGTQVKLTNGTDSIVAESPPALREALVLRLTRMGIMHNLAQLARAALPDHAEGGTAEWVRALDVRREGDGDIAFDIEVGGVESGSVILLMAPGTELPGERRQTVEFPGGTIEVRELDGTMTLGAGIDPSEFSLG